MASPTRHDLCQRHRTGHVHLERPDSALERRDRAGQRHGECQLHGCVNTSPQTGQLPAGETIVNLGSYAFANAAGGNQGTGQSGSVSNGTLSHTLSKSNAPTAGSRRVERLSTV